MRGKCSRLILVVAVAMLFVGSMAESASAFHPVGWFLGVTRGPAVCGSPCDGGWYVGLRPGPVRRFLFGPYRYYPSYGASGYCTPTVFCDICSCDPCCCTSIASTTTTTTAPETKPATVIETNRPTLAPKDADSAPATTTPVAPDPVIEGSDFAPSMTNPYGDSNASPLNQSGTITLNVPTDAKVYVNDYLTQSTGSVRQFVSHNLMAGYDYEYKIRVEIVRGGQVLEANREVVLRSGQTFNVALRHNDLPVSGLAQVQ